MRRINLLPAALIEARQRRRKRRALAFVGVLLLLLGGAWAYIIVTEFAGMSGQVAFARDQLWSEQEEGAAVQRLEREREQLVRVLSWRMAVETPAAPTGVIGLLSEIVPESVALTRLVVDVPPADLSGIGPVGGTGVAAPRSGGRAIKPLRIDLEGVAISDTEVAQLVNRLSNRRELANVRLIQSRPMGVQGAVRVMFQITFDVPEAST